MKGTSRPRKAKSAKASFDGNNPQSLWINPVQRFSNNPTLRTTRTVLAGTITTNTSAAFFRGYSFQLSDCPSPGDFTALFDQYRITRIDVSFLPSALDSTPAAQSSSLVLTVVDYDDATAPTALGDLFEFNNCMVWSGTERLQLSLVPRVARALYTGSFSGYESAEAPWIDIASPAVQHYGLKVAFGATYSVLSYLPVFRYHLEFRSTR